MGHQMMNQSIGSTNYKRYILTG